MISTCLVDYCGTLDCTNAEPLLDVLCAFKSVGIEIFILTDSGKENIEVAQKYMVALGKSREKDYSNFCDGFITRDDVEEHYKSKKTYWPYLLNKYKWNKENIIFIDENFLNIQFAEAYGITSVCPGKESDIEECLFRIYQEKLSQ